MLIIMRWPHMLRKLISGLSALAIVCLFGGYAGAADRQEITVSAAISLKDAFEEIGRLFESRNKEVKIAFNFGASGDLMAQIKGGAPVDVFASAAQKDMDALDTDGFVIKDSLANF